MTHIFGRSRFFVFFGFLVLLVASCKEQTPDHWKKQTLLKYDFAVDVLAPDSSDYKVIDYGIAKDLSITADGYALTILKMPATTDQVANVLSEKKKYAKQNRFFSKIIEEGDDYFIFEKKIDSLKSYDFRKVKIVGNQEYTFQRSLMGTFSEEEVRMLLTAVE